VIGFLLVSFGSTSLPIKGKVIFFKNKCYINFNIIYYIGTLFRLTFFIQIYIGIAVALLARGWNEKENLEISKKILNLSGFSAGVIFFGDCPTKMLCC
jgi:hypothetical protein